MGNSSSQIHDILPPIVSNILCEEPVNTLISDEIRGLTYEKFLTIMGELNRL